MSEQSLQLVEAKPQIAPAISFTPEQIQLIKNTIAKGASDDELKLFLNIAQRTGLDPFARQIFYIKRWDATAGREVGQPQTSIDGYRLIAERTGNYCPGDEATFIERDGRIVSATAYVKKFVRGEWHVISASAFFDEYAQRKKDGSLTSMWQRMPHVMIAKCAEALALRKAFPAELSGLYTREEMMQAENDDPPLPPTKPTPSREFVPVADVIGQVLPEAPIVEAEVVMDIPPTDNAPAAADPRAELIAEIKRKVFQLGFASNVVLWREFERGLLGVEIKQSAQAALLDAREALDTAAKNPDIVRWNSETWACSSELKAYSLGLIIAHAHVDGFEKTKAITGDPSLHRTLEKIKTMNTNLLSWVRPEAMSEQLAA